MSFPSTPSSAVGLAMACDKPRQASLFLHACSAFLAPPFDRAQNAAIHRLHEAQRTGQIKSFVFPYLGQKDRELAKPPVNLVRREEAHAYPTDFDAMTDEWIDRLSLRGEQLTLCLARASVP